MATITNSGNRMIRPNFNESELYSTSLDAPDSHYLSDTALDNLQKFRDWGGRIKVTSTFRTWMHNKSIPRAKEDSQHLEGRAIDFRFLDGKQDEMMTRIRKALSCPATANSEDVDFVNSIIGGEIGKVHGFGMYNDSFHIDSRNDFPSTTSGVAMWDGTQGKYDGYTLNGEWYRNTELSGESIYCVEPDRVDNKKKSVPVAILSALFLGGSEYDEDGISVYENVIWMWILILTVLVLGYIAYKKWS